MYEFCVCEFSVYGFLCVRSFVYGFCVYEFCVYEFCVYEFLCV